MSAPEEELVGQIDISIVDDMLQEPSYISEIVRKLREINAPRGFNEGELEEVETIRDSWGNVTENTALTGVMIIIQLMMNNNPDRYEVTQPQYDVEEGSEFGQSQAIGSSHFSRSEEGPEASNRWKEYAIIHNVDGSEDQIGSSLDNEGFNELGNRVRDVVDTSVTIDDKVSVVKRLSRVGNEMSMYAEEIMQDVMERQFREYNSTEFSDYNDPGSDFLVVDEDRREYGLVIEISVRWVNPIGDPYISNKVNEIIDLEEGEEFPDQPWDLLIMAPKFTNVAIRKYENPDKQDWHIDPLEGMVHLHRVPNKKPEVYRPFVFSVDGLEGDDGSPGGNPVVVPDSDRLRDLARDTGHVGNDYPIVDERDDEFIQLLEDVFREFNIVTESRYRNMMRESIEPLLWEFMRPYKIEQFIIDTYWDKELNQSEIGRLVSRNAGTIGRWMQNWGIMRRGTGAPELSEGVREIWRRMYLGEDPFPQQFSGYRIQAEYNRHPLWDLDDWREWYQDTTEQERQDVIGMQDSFRENLDYTILVGATDRLVPSYTFILSTLDDMGVEIRDPDEAPRVPYSAYPSRDALEWMINKDETTIVDVSEEEQ